MSYSFEFSPINRHSASGNYYSSHCTHSADFEVIDGGRRYWGWVNRYFDREAPIGSRVCLEVSLFTRNSRTQFGMAVAEAHKADLRNAAIASFKQALADWLEAGEPSTYEQRSAKIAAQAEAAAPKPEFVPNPAGIKAAYIPAPQPQPSPSSLEAEALAQALEAAAISDLINAGRAALFALEGVALLQGNREVAAYAVQLGQALAPFAEGAALEGLAL